ncbi:MAG: DUF4252 domain-containing protein [Saprospiraceae bacterium]|jgi:hypothetical protein|nr:DUF4252 domain-containing protein [Saprospiraceae bacterium]MBL0027301.1 DUF4252 domain-containing protein [Saprospiraceae bacterium]
MSIRNILVIGLCFFTLGLSAQKNIDQVFRKYKNDEGVINMNFTGEVLKMINSSDKKLKSSVDVVDILVFQKSADIKDSDKTDIEKLLSRDKFDLLIDVKNKTQKVRLYALDSGDFLNKIYAHVNTNEMNAYFILSGRIIFDELAKLGLDFQSGDALKILDGAWKK